MIKINISFDVIYKIIRFNLLITAIAFMFIVSSGQMCLSNEIKPLLVPSAIQRFVKTGFYYDGRQWSCSALLGAYIKNGILFLSSDCCNRSLTIVTAPGEYNDEKKIYVLNKKYLGIKFDKPINKHVVFVVNIMMEIKNEYKIFEHTIDCFNKSMIKIPLSSEGKAIHRLLIEIKGEEATIGIKSIFLE